MDLLNHLSDTLLPVEVFLGNTKRTIGELKKLKVGDTLLLDKLAGEPLDVFINGKQSAKGEAVVIDENTGIRISDFVSDEELQKLISEAKNSNPKAVKEFDENIKKSRTNNRESKTSLKGKNITKENLAPDEIDNLLTAIAADKGEVFKPVSSVRKIKIYDFKNIKFFSSYELESLVDKMSRFISRFSEDFENCIFTLKSVEEKNYYSYRKGKYDYQPVYKNFAMFDQRLFGKSYITLCASKSLIDNLCSGSKEKKNFQETISNRIFSPFEHNFRKFSCDENFYLEPLYVTENSRLLQEDNSVKIEITINISITAEKDVQGEIKIIIPSKLLHDMIYLCHDEKIEKTESFKSIPVNIQARFGKTIKSLKDISSIGEGTIIELDHLEYEPIDILANGILIAKGRIIVYDELLGVEITQIVSE